MDRRLISIIGLGAAIAVVLVFTAACTSPWQRSVSEKAQEETAEKMLEKASGGQADVDIEDESTTVTTDEGTTTYGSGELPADFPSDVPVYPDATIGFSHVGMGEEAESASLSLETGDGVDKVADWYKTQIPKNSWEITQSDTWGSGADQYVNYTATQGDRELSVGISTADNTTIVTISVIKATQ